MESKERVWTLYECYMESPTTICHNCNKKFVCGDSTCEECSGSTALRTEDEIASIIYKDVSWAMNEKAVTNIIRSYKEKQKIERRNNIIRFVIIVFIILQISI